MKWINSAKDWAASPFRWVWDWWKYRLYKIKQARALKASKDNDPNIYPLW